MPGGMGTYGSKRGRPKKMTPEEKRKAMAKMRMNKTKKKRT